MFIIMMCVLAFTTTLAEEETAEETLERICTTVIDEIARSMESEDVLMIDKALRKATAALQPELRKVAKLTGQSTKQVARTVSIRVSEDQRLFNILAVRAQGKITARSAAIMSKFIAGLVYSALTNP